MGILGRDEEGEVNVALPEVEDQMEGTGVIFWSREGGDSNSAGS